MGDILNDEQTEVLASYQSLTGEEDMERSIQVLRNSNWDLQRAIAGGSTPGSPSVPSRPNTSVQRFVNHCFTI